MERTYVFHERNGSGSFIVSAENKKDAIQYMKNVGLRPNEWVLGEIEK